jgi:hypothetical protein
MKPSNRPVVITTVASLASARRVASKVPRAWPPIPGHSVTVSRYVEPLEPPLKRRPAASR